MPLINKDRANNDGAWGIWKIDEEVDQLLSQLELNEFDQVRFESLKLDKTRKEFLSSRLIAQSLLKDLGVNYKGIYRDEFKKPHFAECGFHISISHGDGHSAVVVDPEKPVGIDIQCYRDKIFNIARRIFSESENQDFDKDLRKITLYWSAKEVLYKIDGRRGLNFINNLFIEPFELKESGEFGGRIVKADLEDHYTLSYHLFDEFVLVYSS